MISSGMRTHLWRPPRIESALFIKNKMQYVSESLQAPLYELQKGKRKQSLVCKLALIKGAIDPETPCGKRLLTVAHLVQLGQSRARWEGVKRRPHYIDPKIKECYEDGLGAHDSRPFVCSSDTETDRRTPKKSVSGRKARRQTRAVSDISAILPELNMFLSGAAENEKIITSYPKGVFTSQSETSGTQSKRPIIKMDVTGFIFT